MIWDQEVVIPADRIEKLIGEDRRHEALKLFRELRKETHIDPPPPQQPASLSTGSHFGTVPLPDEDW